MSDAPPDRRRFLVRAGLAAGAGALAPALGGAAALASVPRRAGPWIRVSSARPALVASANALRALEDAMERLAGGEGTLEAAVGAANAVEADPEDESVGYGGLPNADGVVELDSQVWHGPTRGVGAVAALRGYALASRVAVAVMRYTDHVLLVGEGAARFAREMGFPPTELLTDAARRRWLRWRAELSREDDHLEPAESGEPIRGFRDPGGAGAREPDADGEGIGRRESHDGVRPWGTVHCAAVDAAGAVSAVTSTSGLFFKLPGRVGDSPLPGCGCYADNDVGAAGATGRGEAVMKTVGAHLVVEEMRRGATPTDACLTALRRIVAWTVEPRLMDEEGRPSFNVTYYAVSARGGVGSAALWSGSRYAVHDGRDHRLSDSAYLFERR